ncbi:MAG: hypothetical protein JHC93_01780 [Parachlamydiales bacterium]|nr:hypothetical protein [Parachlamydiales bacterium]
MIALQKVSSFLHLTNDEEHKITSCIQDYLKNNPVTTVANAIFSIVGQSDWQDAKNIINDHLAHTFKQIFKYSDANKIQDYADKASEFVLNCIIAQETMDTCKDSSYFNDLFDELQKLDVKEIILRASQGNGKTLPKIDLKVIDDVSLSCMYTTFKLREIAINITGRHFRKIHRTISSELVPLADSIEACEDAGIDLDFELNQDRENAMYRLWSCQIDLENNISSYRSKFLNS